MTKSKFLSLLEDGLSTLPQCDIEERLNFYKEIIDDRMDDGIPEEEAVAEIGTVNEIVAQILEEYPSKPKRRMGAWEITLIILGFPLWLPLLIAAFAVVLSVYAVLWSVVVSVWAVEVSLWGSGLGCLVAGLLNMVIQGNMASGVVLLGTAFICAGLSIFVLYGCKFVTKGMVCLTKIIWSFIFKPHQKGRR